MNTSTDVYVDPVVNRPRRVAPTGVSAPAECAFATITDAIASAEARGLGSGARIILTGASATAPAVLREETFPLAIPAGITVTTADDPALGGAGLDPKRYVVSFTGRAAYAADLEGGRLAGLTLKNERATRATIMLICDAGTTVIDAVRLDGAGSSGGAVSKGLQLWPGCDLDASALRVRGFAGNGVVVEEGANLTLGPLDLGAGESFRSAIHNNGGNGLVIRGETAVSEADIAFNGDDGILVERSTSARFHLNDVYDNAENGFEIHPSNVSFTSNRIFNNSRGAGWDQPQLLFVGPSDPYGVQYWTGSEYVLAYRFGTDDCELSPADSNRIHSYNTEPGSSSGSVGLRAVEGAIVNADGNQWRTTAEVENVSIDDVSDVNADEYCPPSSPITVLASFPSPALD